eukprot:15689-Heterococcus_DN1.PRE.1
MIGCSRFAHDACLDRIQDMHYNAVDLLCVRCQMCPLSSSADFDIVVHRRMLVMDAVRAINCLVLTRIVDVFHAAFLWVKQADADFDIMCLPSCMRLLLMFCLCVSLSVSVCRYSSALQFSSTLANDSTTPHQQDSRVELTLREVKRCEVWLRPGHAISGVFDWRLHFGNDVCTGIAAAYTYTSCS